MSLNSLVEVFSTGDSSLKCSLVTLRDRWLVITPSNTDHNTHIDIALLCAECTQFTIEVWSAISGVLVTRHDTGSMNPIRFCDI